MAFTHPAVSRRQRAMLTKRRTSTLRPSQPVSSCSSCRPLFNACLLTTSVTSPYLSNWHSRTPSLCRFLLYQAPPIAAQPALATLVAWSSRSFRTITLVPPPKLVIRIHKNLSSSGESSFTLGSSCFPLPPPSNTCGSQTHEHVSDHLGSPHAHPSLSR